jgi:hypothetical protein
MDCCIDLPTFCHTEHTTALANASIDYNINDCQTKSFTFLTINVIDEYFSKDLGRNICEIGSNGEFYKVDITKNQLLKLLNISYYE